MSNSKPRLVKDYDQLSEQIHEQIKLAYPRGYHKHLVSFVNREGKRVSALPFETEEVYYLVRMTQQEARDIIQGDDDFDDSGFLKADIKEEYEEKYTESFDDEDEIPADEDDDD